MKSRRRSHRRSKRSAGVPTLSDFAKAIKKNKKSGFSMVPVYVDPGMLEGLLPPQYYLIDRLVFWDKRHSKLQKLWWRFTHGWLW